MAVPTEHPALAWRSHCVLWSPQVYCMSTCPGYEVPDLEACRQTRRRPQEEWLRVSVKEMSLVREDAIRHSKFWFVNLSSAARRLV